MLHPESTAYDLFDGDLYRINPLPVVMSEPAKRTQGKVDPRPGSRCRDVLGVRIRQALTFPLDGLPERACLTDKVGDLDISCFLVRSDEDSRCV